MRTRTRTHHHLTGNHNIPAQTNVTELYPSTGRSESSTLVDNLRPAPGGGRPPHRSTHLYGDGGLLPSSSLRYSSMGDRMSVTLNGVLCCRCSADRFCCSSADFGDRLIASSAALSSGSASAGHGENPPPSADIRPADTRRHSTAQPLVALGARVARVEPPAPAAAGAPPRPPGRGAGPPAIGRGGVGLGPRRPRPGSRAAGRQCAGVGGRAAAAPRILRPANYCVEF